MTRPFRGLRDQAPRASYDAVVIGAGVGGLVCANLLARSGLSVLLCEQHYMVGGYCSTFKRRHFTFDAATHFYPLLGNPTTLTGKLLTQLGMQAGWVKMDPVDTFHLPDGSRFEVPSDLDLYLEQLRARFPEEREAIDLFFEEVREAYMSGLLAYFRERVTPRMKRLERLTLSEALDRRFRDEKLKLILTADCPHWGSPPSRTSFVFDSMLRLSYFLGNYYPEGGSQAFVDDLARVFEEQGGHILMSSRVESIRVEGGRAVGVEIETLRGRLRGRHSVSARYVVANTDLTLLLERLLPAEHVPQSQLDEVRSLRPSFPCFLCHIGLSGVDPAALERAQGYYWNHWDFDAVGRDALRCKIFVPTLYEPRMAPPGGQVVLLQKVQEIDYDAVDDWPAHKAAVEAGMMAHLEQVVPEVRGRIVVSSSASAATSRRFTSNLAGAMLGWEMSPDQLGERRPSIEGPVEGLFRVGHWVRPGGGITPVIISAAQVAERVTGERAW